MLEFGAFTTPCHDAMNLQPRHPLWQLTLLRWRMFVREPAAVFWTYGFPGGLALALGVAFRNRLPEPVEVAVEAFPECEAWGAALAANSEVHVRWLSPQAAREALRVGKVSVVVGRIGAPNSAFGASPKVTLDQLKSRATNEERAQGR